MSASDPRSRLRQLGQLDLGAWVEAATGGHLWSVQQRVARAGSSYRARVSVPSCTASGKTYLAGRLALAFYDAYTPGTPCETCNGPCGGCRVITLASKFEHLRDVMWGEIRTAHEQMRRRGIILPGRLGVGQTLRLDDGPSHLMVGQSPSTAEGLQGIHAAHILVIGDEATALPEEVTKGLVSSLATGDARLLIIFNPTTADTWAADVTRSPRTQTIKITAWDTPLFTEESVPDGSYLLTPDYLEELKAAGQGPGTFDWTTKVEADFWDKGNDTLIPDVWVENSYGAEPVEGTRAIGIDLAPYGSNENVIAFRNGNIIVKVEASASMRQDLFWAGPVTEAVLDFAPHYLIYDADGVGAGVIGYAETAARALLSRGHAVQLLPFRGALSVQTKFRNARSAWWWHLRHQFENGAVSLQTHDPKLREQLTRLRYSITETGDIRVESKEELKRRDRGDIDRADAVMYAFALQDSLPILGASTDQGIVSWSGVPDRSFGAMQRRDLDRVANRRRHSLDRDWL